MVSSRNSTLNVISTKITENLDKVFWKGKGDHKEFREKMKQSIKELIYQYVLLCYEAVSFLYTKILE